MQMDAHINYRETNNFKATSDRVQIVNNLDSGFQIAVLHACEIRSVHIADVYGHLLFELSR